MQAEFRFLPLGGTSVGASCYLYELGGTRLLIDCGIQPGLLGEASLPKLELLADNRPDALILTHAHSDHIGAPSGRPGIGVEFFDDHRHIVMVEDLQNSYAQMFRGTPAKQSTPCSDE